MSDFELNNLGRISHPVYLAANSSRYESITWEDAFGKIASALKACSTPDNAVFYTSGRTSNEAAFLYQAFVRAFGTNNLPDCSNMCHESSGKGLGQTIGIGKGTVSLDDFLHADTILVIGQNPEPITPVCSPPLEMQKSMEHESSMSTRFPRQGCLDSNILKTT